LKNPADQDHQRKADDDRIDDQPGLIQPCDRPGSGKKQIEKTFSKQNDQDCEAGDRPVKKDFGRVRRNRLS